MESAKKKYKILMFDLGNTVIRFDHHISARKIAALAGRSEQAIYEMFFDSEITRRFDSGKILPSEFHSQVSKRLGITLTFDEFIAVWSGIFWPDEAVCAIIKELKPAHTLFLISNINQVHFEYIRSRFTIIEAFDAFVLSYQIGCLKPDIRIYEAAARMGNAAFSEILYVDDREDLTSQSAGLGIDSIRFTDAAALKKELIARGCLP